MSRALRQEGGSSDIPKFLFKSALWGWFLYRTGEELLYYVLRILKIPHTPKWKYDHNKKFSENEVDLENWKKQRLFGAPTIETNARGRPMLKNSSTT
ncbi:hypothetical protein AKO1_010500 [Acrasis kona]|uniref:Uncharacterized protein n=1 Tax=Acrasis kona TaxID=1008807 RepID=A0AAW2ZHW6_9EUKA